LSRRRKFLLLGFLVLVAAAAILIVLDSGRRVQGWVGSEPFFQGRAASAWGRDLRQPDETRAADAFNALSAGKGEAVPVCIWVLQTAPEPEARWRAADALAHMGKDASPAGPQLIIALSDSDPLVRGVAIRGVAELAPDLRGAVGALVPLFPDVDAIRAVSRFGERGDEAVPSLIALLNHDDATVRWQSARTLGKIRTPALPAVPELSRLTIADPDPQVREHAAEAIGDIGPAAVKGLPALVKALSDPMPRVRRDAVRALGQLGPAAKDALAEVLAATKDADPAVKDAAVRAARLIAPGAKTAN
jgi:HEAT repeat protein